MGEMWITQYNDFSEDWTPEKFRNELMKLEEDVRPFYNKLHAYIRMKLKKNPMYKDKIPESGHIPIEMLGNMWGQVRPNFKIKSYMLRAPKFQVKMIYLLVLGLVRSGWRN